MRAVIVDSPGGPEQMRVAELPDPAFGADEVLIDVVATAVNRADLLQRQGQYHPPPGASEVLGLECSGRIAASRRSGARVGPSVTRCAHCSRAAGTRLALRCRLAA